MITPGPWEIEKPIVGAPEIIGNKRRIAKALYWVGSEDDQVHDNARLIAAAPDLLFAAEQALMAIEEGYDAPKVRDDLRAAIAKAKGEE